jgi:hypothetical protein
VGKPAIVPNARSSRKQEASVPAGAAAELEAESVEAATAPAVLPANPTAAASLLEESETYVMAVAAALAGLADQGFPSQFEVSDGGVHCLACRSNCNTHDVAWLAHTEVTSSAGDQTSLVCGLRCPICGSRGTATATVEQWERRRGGGARSHTHG